MSFIESRKSILKAYVDSPERFCEVLRKEIDCDRNGVQLDDQKSLCNCCKEVWESYGKGKISFTYSEMKICDASLTCPEYDSLATHSITQIVEGFNAKCVRIPHPYLNYVLTNVIMEKVLGRNINLMSAYLCNNNLIAVSDPTAEHITNDTEIEPIRVLTSFSKIIHGLSDYDFCHGEPEAKYIKIVDNQFTLEPSFFSSITYKGKRNFYSTRRINLFNFKPPSVVREMFPLKKGFECLNECRIITDKIVETPGFYLNYELIEAQRNYGLPLYGSAIDTYFFLCSLFTYDGFFELISNKKFSKIWEGMWRIDDAEKVKQSILELKEKDLHSFSDIYSILSFYPLRIDISLYLYKNLVK